jgi:hypothetical protein
MSEKLVPFVMKQPHVLPINYDQQSAGALVSRADWEALLEGEVKPLE